MVALAALLVATFGGTHAPPVPSPYAIFDRAGTFWYDQDYPAFLDYDIAVQVRQRDSARVERYRSSFDATNGAIWVDSVSDYERAHPVVVRGMNVCILVLCLTKPLPPIDFIGVPLLTPTYSFGMAPFIPVAPPNSAQAQQALVNEIRREFHDPYPRGRKPLEVVKNGLPTIAHASVTAGVYDITLVGIENVQQHECYHLSLRARRDPGRYRLRDLWVDVRSGATWRLREALNFIEGPGTTVPWTVDFDSIAGVQYIAQEAADAPIRYQGQTYSQTTVSFENVRAVTIPQGDPVYVTPRTTTLEEPN